jgi:hypothetical protein
VQQTWKKAVDLGIAEQYTPRSLSRAARFFERFGGRDIGLRPDCLDKLFDIVGFGKRNAGGGALRSKQPTGQGRPPRQSLLTFLSLIGVGNNYCFGSDKFPVTTLRKLKLTAT